MTVTLKKIAYLTGEYPRASDTFIQREVAALRAVGHDVVTCSIRRTDASHHVGPEQIAEAAQTFNVLPAAMQPMDLMRAIGQAVSKPRRFLGALGLAIRTAPPGLRGHLYQLFYLIEACILARHLLAHKVDHLHNHIAKASCTVAMLASKLSGVPFSFTIHGPDIFFEPKTWRIDVKAQEASFVACISHFCRSQLMCFAPVDTWHGLTIVHCGVDPVLYDTERTGAPGKRLLFVGRLARVKGIEVLFDALQDVCKLHPEISVRLVGDGPERAGLEALAKAKGLPVTFLGYQSQAAVAAELQNTDLFVLPSFAEGVPVVLMEALAASVPVVTTRIAGVPELVEDGVSGRLVPPGDPVALASAISELLNDPDRRMAMGTHGAAHVRKEYDMYTEARKLSELIEATDGAKE